MSFFIFIFLTTSFYFSDQNVASINKSRSVYPLKVENITNNLPLLRNDTSDIIEYRTDVEAYKKKKKNYKFWELIKK